MWFQLHSKRVCGRLAPACGGVLRDLTFTEVINVLNVLVRGNNRVLFVLPVASGMF